MSQKLNFPMSQKLMSYVAKSEAFNVTQTNFFNIAKSTTYLDVTKIKFYNVTETDRSSPQRCSIKQGVPRNFAKFRGKYLCQRLFFNKVAGLRSATLLKRSHWHKCFPVNFAKFLRTLFL